MYINCFHCLSITLKLVRVCIFRCCLIKKSNTLEDEKSISNIFKALEIGVLNLIGFQAAGIFCRLQVAGCRLKFHYNCKTAGTKKKGKAIDLP